MKYSITIGLEPLHGSHDDPTTMVSTFDLERNSFPVTVESGQGAEGMEEDTLFLSMTPNLGQIMLMFKMTYAYLDNNNNGDLHRELLLACLLCVMKNCVRKMNSLKLDVLNEDYEENMKEIQRMHPGTVQKPLIACNYRTSARKRKREKGDRMKISFPSEKQTIKTFVANLHRCKGCIRKGQSHISKMPSPSRQPLIPRNVGTKRKRIIDSDDERDVNKLYNLNTSAFNCFKLKNSAKIMQTIFLVAASLQSLDSNYLGKFEISPNNTIASFSPTISHFKTAAIHPPELLQSSPVLGAPFRKTVREDEHLVSG